MFLTFKETFDISLNKITSLITVNFVIQIIVDLIAAKYVDKIGYRKSIIAAHVFSGAGLISLAVAPFVFPSAYAGLLFSVLLYAVGGGLIEVLISPIVEACPSENKTAAMSLLHSFYCWGCVGVVLISTLFFSVFGKENWRIMCVVWALIPIANALFFCGVPIASLTPGEKGMTIRELARNGAFWLFVLLMFASGSSEQAMSQWASAFAESGLHVSKTIGDLAGPCMFSVLMGTARVVSSKLSKKIDLLNSIIFCGFLCIASYLIASLSPYSGLSLLGCAVCGFSVGLLWPGVFSLASSKFRRGGTALFALLALAGDLGCSGGPTYVGLISSAFGDNLKVGILGAVIFPVLLIVCAFLYKKRFSENNRNCR